MAPGSHRVIFIVGTQRKAMVVLGGSGQNRVVSRSQGSAGLDGLDRPQRAPAPGATGPAPGCSGRTCFRQRKARLG
jgi:hypothetical protein